MTAQNPIQQKRNQTGLDLQLLKEKLIAGPRDLHISVLTFQNSQLKDMVLRLGVEPHTGANQPLLTDMQASIRKAQRRDADVSESAKPIGTTDEHVSELDPFVVGLVTGSLTKTCSSLVDKSALRRLALKQLLDEAPQGTRESVRVALGWKSTSNLSQLTSGTRAITDEMALKLEAALSEVLGKAVTLTPAETDITAAQVAISEISRSLRAFKVRSTSSSRMTSGPRRHKVPGRLAPE